MAHRPHVFVTSSVGRTRVATILGAVTAVLFLSGCSTGLQDGGLATMLGGSKSAETADAAKIEADAHANGRGDLEKATAYWQKEFAGNPRNIDAAVNYAKNLKAMGEKDRAIAVLQQASMYNSDHKGLASEYGRLALENDQAALAEKLLARAEDPLKPDWKVISAQGAAIAKQGRHREAIPKFERALALSPDNPAVLNNLGMAQAMNGDAVKAEATLRKAADLPGAAPRVRQNLALVVGLQGKFDEARQISGADLPPEKTAENIAYLRRMIDHNGGSQAATTLPPLPPATGPASPKLATAKLASTGQARPKPVTAQVNAGSAGLKGTQGAIIAGSDQAASGWSTEVANAAAPVSLRPPALTR